MTKREKVLIAVTVVATGASVFMFAFVSLANFLKTTPTSAPPLIAKMYDSTLDQLATLEPVPVAAVSADMAATASASGRNQATGTYGNQIAASHSNKNDLKVSAQSNNSQLQASLQLSASELAELSKILKEAGLDPKDPKLLTQLKNFGL
jgi:hypothetical protein